MQGLTLPIAVAWSYVKLSLARRIGFFMSLAITLLTTWILVGLWAAIRQNSVEAQAEFTAAELATYIVVAQVVSLARMSHANRQFFYQALRHVHTGEIAMDLVRPIDNQILRYSQWLGVFAVDALMVALPTWLVFRLTGVIGDPHSGVQALLFAVSVALGWLVTAGFHYLMAALTLVITQTPGVNLLRVALQEVLGGGFIPLALMPGWLATAAVIFPFHAMVSSPTLIYIGHLQGVDALAALGIQAAWGVGLIVTGRVLWLQLVRRVLIQGG